LSSVATLDPATKASDQKAKSAVEPSLGTEQKKTSSIKWSCSTCQANGMSQSTLEEHLKGKRHRQNIAATYVEGKRMACRKQKDVASMCPGIQRSYHQSGAVAFAKLLVPVKWT
jgi:hypothetical protein